MGYCGTPGNGILAAAAAAAAPPVPAVAAIGFVIIIRIHCSLYSCSVFCVSIFINLVKVSSNCSWLSSAFESLRIISPPLLYLQCLISTQYLLIDLSYLSHIHLCPMYVMTPCCSLYNSIVSTFVDAPVFVRVTSKRSRHLRRIRF